MRCNTCWMLKELPTVKVKGLLLRALNQKVQVLLYALDGCGQVTDHFLPFSIRGVYSDASHSLIAHADIQCCGVSRAYDGLKRLSTCLAKVHIAHPDIAAFLDIGHIAYVIISFTAYAGAFIDGLGLLQFKGIYCLYGFYA